MHDSTSTTSPSRRSGRIGAAGVACIVLALVANRRWLAALSPDGEIRNPFYGLLIVTMEVSLIGLGILLLGLRNHPQRLRGVLLRLALAGFSMLLFLGGLEVFLRVRPAPARYALDLYSAESTGRLRLKPNYRVTTRIGRTPLEIVTNSRGMRWREVAPQKTRPRVAFVGDSFTFGEWSNSNAESFVGVFDSLAGRDRFEVLNFGVPSYGLVEVRLQIQEDVLPLEPDWLFLMFCNGNDLSDTFLGPERYRVEQGVAVWDTTYIGGRIGTGGAQVWGMQPRGVVGPHEVISSSRAVHFFADFYNTRLAAARRQRSEFYVMPSPLAFSYWSGVPDTPVRTAAVQATLAELDRIVQLCAAHGVRLVVVTIPFAEQVHVAQPVGNGYDTGLPQRHIAELVRARGIPHLDLLPLLRAYAAGSGAKLYCAGDPHFDNTGHLVTGIALSAFFRSLLEGTEGEGAAALPHSSSLPAPRPPRTAG